MNFYLQMAYWYRSPARLGPRILSTITWSDEAQCTLNSWLTKMYSKKVFSHPLLSYRSGHFHPLFSIHYCFPLQLPSIRLTFAKVLRCRHRQSRVFSSAEILLALKVLTLDVAACMSLGKPNPSACWVVAGPNQTTSASLSNRILGTVFRET